MDQENHRRLFVNVLAARDGAFEEQRKILFANKAAVAQLSERFNDPDRVIGFAARELHLWATANDSTYADLEKFLTVTEPELKATSKSAKGGGGSDALFSYLAPFLKNEPAKADRLMKHLLLRALMQPNQYSYIFSVLSQYYSSFPTPEPEVWIRATLARSNVPNLFQFIVESNLGMVEPARLKQALDHEHSSAFMTRQPWPAEYEALRRSLPGKP